MSTAVRSGRRAAERVLTISVGDSGGTPIQYRERVFDKLFRVEHETTEADAGVRGTGIGLYLAREIAEAHGGTLRCVSGSNGRGARFVLTPSYLDVAIDNSDTVRSTYSTPPRATAGHVAPDWWSASLGRCETLRRDHAGRSYGAPMFRLPRGAPRCACPTAARALRSRLNASAQTN